MAGWLVRIDTASKVYLCIVGEEPVMSLSKVIKGATEDKAKQNAIKFLNSIALVPDGNPDFAMLLQQYIVSAIGYINKGESNTSSGTHGMSLDVIKG